MGAAFDGAAVPRAAIERLESAMTNDPKDRHVLATAVASGAHAVVTLNLRHFPPAACAPLAIEPLHPDAFLLGLYARDGSRVYAAVARQAAVLRRPPITLEELLARLAVTAPQFAAALRRHA